MITDKTKQAFEKWYFKNHCKSSMKFKELMPHHKEDVFGWFYNLSISFKYGVYIDFFDSVGIHVMDGFYGYQVVVPNELTVNEKTKSRPEAREQAIKKANQIFNNK